MGLKSRSSEYIGYKDAKGASHPSNLAAIMWDFQGLRDWDCNRLSVPWVLKVGHGSFSAGCLGWEVGVRFPLWTAGTNPAMQLQLLDRHTPISPEVSVC